MQKFTRNGEDNGWRRTIWHLCQRCVLSARSVCRRLDRFAGTPGVLLACAWLLAFQPTADRLRQITPISGQHATVITVDLILPDFPSKTHMQQASDFANKLIIGFGLRPEVALEFSD